MICIFLFSLLLSISISLFEKDYSYIWWGFFISHLKIDFDASLSKLSVTIGTTIVGIDNLERSLNKPFLKTPGDSSVEYDAPSGT